MHRDAQSLSHAHTHTQTDTHTQIHMHVHVHTCTPMRAHTHVQTHAHIDTHRYTHTCAQAQHSYICDCMDLQKPSQIAQELKFNLLLNIKPTLLLYPETPNTWL